MKIVKIDKEEAVEEYGLKYTGEVITIERDCSKARIRRSHVEGIRVIKHWFTPQGFIRDCGDHYILAGLSSYTRIDKKTLEITPTGFDI